MQNLIELEMSVLSALMQWGKNELKDKAFLISKDDFTSPVLSEMFVILSESRFNTSVMQSHLETDIDLKLYQKIREEPAFITEFEHLVNRMKEISSSKRLKQRMIDIAMTHDLEVVSTDMLQEIIDSELENIQGIDTSLNDISEYQESLRKPRNYIKTGFAGLDGIISGLEVPSVCIIGARPSTGKTSFALNIALNASKAKVKSMIFSLEMSYQGILDRIISNAGGILYEKFIDRCLTEKDFEFCDKFVDWLKNKSIVISDKINSIESIAVAVRREKPKLVIVDYIQIISTVRRFPSAREQINYISAECKRIARDNNCCVIVLSQIRRGGKDAPTMADLRESGALEADGDYVMLLHRPYVLDKCGDCKPNETYLLIDKNKYGKCGQLEFNFKGEFQKFIGVDFLGRK